MDYAQVLKSMIVCTGASGDNPCDFEDLINLVKIFMDNLIVVSIFLATLGFIYVGFEFLTSQGNPGAKSYAKKVLWNVIVGLFFVLAAWVIVYTISKVLIDDKFILLKGIGQ